jgi:hypothetical protein
MVSAKMGFETTNGVPKGLDIGDGMDTRVY